MKLASSLAAVALLAACATEPFPSKRPLTSDAMETMGQTKVVITESNNAIQASWFAQDSSAAGASYGIIGALTTAVMDAIANAGPSRRANRVASEVYETVDADFLTSSIVEAFASLDSVSDDLSVVYGEVSSRQPLLDKTIPLDAINISATYSLAENASAFSVTAFVTIDRADIDYVTPYTFEKTVPKQQLEGLIYQNTFSYGSKRFEVPYLTEEMKSDLATAIENSYRDEDGNLPEADSKDAKSLAKELEKARDDKLTKSEASVFMVNNWITDDGAELKAEIKNAHEFIAKYVIADLNDTAVPSLDGEDRIVETADDGRVVVLQGAGFTAGSYSSQPGGVADFVTYGNARATASNALARAKRIKNNRDTSS